MDRHRVFFITLVTAGRRTILRRERAARELLETLALDRADEKYLLHEFVVMPDHLHALITLRRGISLERAMQVIKGGFSSRMRARGPVWQATVKSYRIRDFADYERHREYIRLNPVWAQLVERAEAYPYASAAGQVRLDTLPRGIKPVRAGEPVARRDAA